MHASEFDYEINLATDLDLTLPDSYDEWPVGDGSGVINRRQDGDDGHVILDVRVSPNGYILIEQMPICCEDTGGLEGRFGDWTPADPDSGPMADYQPDVRDQLQNKPLGDGGNSFDYHVYGRVISESDMHGGVAPTDPDLTPQQVREWAKARGDTHAAQVWSRLATEMS